MAVVLVPSRLHVENKRFLVVSSLHVGGGRMSGLPFLGCFVYVFLVEATRKKHRGIYPNFCPALSNFFFSFAVFCYCVCDCSLSKRENNSKSNMHAHRRWSENEKERQKKKTRRGVLSRGLRLHSRLRVRHLHPLLLLLPRLPLLPPPLLLPPFLSLTLPSCPSSPLSRHSP